MSLKLDGAGKKILMDFSATVQTERGAFQTTVLNGSTTPYILPNGTGNTAALALFNSSNPTNASFLNIGINDTNAFIQSFATGSGTLKNLIVSVGGSNSIDVRTGGEVIIGNPSRNSQLKIVTTARPSPMWSDKELILENTASGGSQPGIAFHAAGNQVAGILKFYGPAASFEFRTWDDLNFLSVKASAFTVNSDYRLKNITGPVTNSGQFIDSLKPKQGTWKADGSKFVGFIAHEVQEVSPSSVHGEKDAAEVNGNPIYQGMDYSSSEIIANMVAELQALRLRVAALEAKGA